MPGCTLLFVLFPMAHVPGLLQSYIVDDCMHVEDFADLIDIDIDAEEEGVDTVLGLMAKRLGRVPIPGASIEEAGWNLTAESGAGRRNRIGTVRADRIQSEGESEHG